MFKRYVTTALTAAMLFSASALAEAPTSQFGFKGWPYRQQTNCNTPEPVCTPEPEIPTMPPQIGDNGCETPPFATPAPTKEPAATTPVATAAPTATIEPTQKPQVTPIPTAQPTAVPTAVPTVKPTAKPTAAPTATKAPSSDDDYTTDSISMQEQTAWNLMNSDRVANGMSALPLDAELSRIARIKAEDMRDNGYFAHESPTYGSPSEMLRYFGYSFSAAGENIAHHANVTKAQAAFMSSDGHRRNILSSTWTKVGIGVCYDAQGYVYVTQLFAR